MCNCGETEVLISSQIIVVCAGCGRKKAERITHLDLSSNEVGQSSSKVPVEDKLCTWCDDGTLDSKCGDCHNSSQRCSEPNMASCYDCEWDITPYAGRKLLPGELGWKELCAKEPVGEETLKDPRGQDWSEGTPKESSEPCRHENIVWKRNSYKQHQRRCRDCKQWLPNSAWEEDYVSYGTGPPVIPEQPNQKFAKEGEVVVPFTEDFKIADETPKPLATAFPTSDETGTFGPCKRPNLTCLECDLSTKDCWSWE